MIENFISFTETHLHFLVPALVPWHVGGGFNHVVSVPARNWDESNGLWIVTDLLDVVGNLR